MGVWLGCYCCCSCCVLHVSCLCFSLCTEFQLHSVGAAPTCLIIKFYVHPSCLNEAIGLYGVIFYTVQNSPYPIINCCQYKVVPRVNNGEVSMLKHLFHGHCTRHFTCVILMQKWLDKNFK